MEMWYHLSLRDQTTQMLATIGDHNAFNNGQNTYCTAKYIKRLQCYFILYLKHGKLLHMTRQSYFKPIFSFRIKKEKYVLHVV